jgi:uracil-DNA glycosylase
MEDQQAAELVALYEEIHAHYRDRDPDLVPRVLIVRALSSRIMLLGQALAEKTQRLSGIPYCLPPSKHPRLSRGGRELDSFLFTFGYTIDPAVDDRQYAYHTDLAHYFPGKTGAGFGDFLPSVSEMAHDRAWFEREVHILHPEVIVALGRKPAHEFARRYQGRPVPRLADLEIEPSLAEIGGSEVSFIAVHHPSGAFHHRSSKNRYARAAKYIKQILER